MYGYQQKKEEVLARLRRVEGQVRGLERMVTEDAYCIDILTQITSLVAASEKVASILMQDHLDHCVQEAMEGEGEAEEKISEFKAALERFLRI